MTPAQREPFLRLNPRNQVIKKTDLAKVETSFDLFPDPQRVDTRFVRAAITIPGSIGLDALLWCTTNDQRNIPEVKQWSI
jgi:hypothetical protein